MAVTDKNNAKCPVCGKAYKVCKTCAKANLISWKTVTDTLDCFKVFTILHEVFVTKKISKIEAQEKLAEIDLSEIETYPKHIRQQLEEIMEKAVTETIIEIAEDIKVEETVVDIIEETTIEEVEVIDNTVEEEIKETKEINETVETVARTTKRNKRRNTR